MKLQSNSDSVGDSSNGPQMKVVNYNTARCLQCRLQHFCFAMWKTIEAANSLFEYGPLFPFKLQMGL